MKKSILAAFAFFSFLVPSAVAHEFKAGAIVIGHPWSRATPPSAKVGGAYFTVTNTGAEPDALVSAKAVIADRAEFHSMTIDGEVMKMAKVEEPLVIKPGESITFEPGGMHLMLFDLKAGLKEGETFSGELGFEKAGPIKVEFAVDKMGAKAPSKPKADTGDAGSHGSMNHDAE